MKRVLYVIIGLLGVMVVCIPASTIQSSGPRPGPRDMKAVRRAYMILSTLNHIDRYDRVYSLTDSREEARRADFVTFSLRPLRSGPITEILNEKLYDLVTPRSGDVLDVARHTHQHNEDPVTFVSFIAEWRTEAQPPDRRTVLEIMGEAISSARYDRYMQYEVTIMDGRKRRSHKAMAAFGGSLEEGMTGAMTFVDLVVDGEALGLALAERLMPMRVPFSEFTESEHYRDLVRRARSAGSFASPQLQGLIRRVGVSPSMSVPSPQSYTCPLGYQSDPYGCCDEVTMHCCFPFEWTGLCGISRSDVYCTCSGAGGGGESGGGGGGGAPPPTCTPYDEWADPEYNSWYDLQWHDVTYVGNHHSGWMQSQGHCKHKSDCTTKGEVIAWGFPSYDKFDSQNTTDGRCHKIGLSVNSKNCVAGRGTQCTASRAIGFAVRACADCSCSVSVSISYSGAGWSVAAADAFHTVALQNDVVCAGG